MNANKIIACEKCGTEISGSQKKVFFGLCSNCFQLENKSLKHSNVLVLLFGLFILLIGVLGVSSSAGLLILEVMSSPDILYSIFVIIFFGFFIFASFALTMGGYSLLKRWFSLRKFIREPITKVDEFSLVLTDKEKKDDLTRISSISLLSTFFIASFLGLFFGGVIGTIIELAMNPQSEITGYEGGFQGAIVGAILFAIIGPLIQVLIKSINDNKLTA